MINYMKMVILTLPAAIDLTIIWAYFVWLKTSCQYVSTSQQFFFGSNLQKTVPSNLSIFLFRPTYPNHSPQTASDSSAAQTLPTNPYCSMSSMRPTRSSKEAQCFPRTAHVARRPVRFPEPDRRGWESFFPPTVLVADTVLCPIGLGRFAVSEVF